MELCLYAESYKQASRLLILKVPTLSFKYEICYNIQNGLEVTL